MFKIKNLSKIFSSRKLESGERATSIALFTKRENVARRTLTAASTPCVLYLTPYTLIGFLPVFWLMYAGVAMLFLSRRQARMDFYSINFIHTLHDGQNTPQAEKAFLPILLESAVLSIYLEIKFSDLSLVLAYMITYYIYLYIYIYISL